MTNRNLLIALRLIALLVIDIFIISRFELGIYFVPHIYFLSILALPVRATKSTVLLFAFFTGIIMDVFMSTGGLHAASSVLMAFVRIFTLRIYVTPEDEDNNITPGLYTFGPRRYIWYSVVLILLHQLTFFSLEVFKSDSIWLILKKTVASTILNTLLLVFIQILFAKPPKKKNERRKR